MYLYLPNRCTSGVRINYDITLPGYGFRYKGIKENYSIFIRCLIYILPRIPFRNTSPTANKVIKLLTKNNIIGRERVFLCCRIPTIEGALFVVLIHINPEKIKQILRAPSPSGLPASHISIPENVTILIQIFPAICLSVSPIVQNIILPTRIKLAKLKH